MPGAALERRPGQREREGERARVERRARRFVRDDARARAVTLALGELRKAIECILRIGEARKVQTQRLATVRSTELRRAQPRVHGPRTVAGGVPERRSNATEPLRRLGRITFAQRELG